MAKAALVDMTKCTACRGCQVACKEWNGNPAEKTENRGTYENPPRLSASTWTRIEFYELERGWFFRKHQCVHCTEASCVEVCPVAAMHHEGEFVIVNRDTCIGCGYCSLACPFDAVYIAPPKGIARKCWFCLDRMQAGIEPACVKTCPTDAIVFGDRGDILEKAHARVQLVTGNGHSRARIYGERELGGLHWIYILDGYPSEFGLPEAPRLATHSIVGQWVGGIITAGALAAVPFWLLFRRMKRLQEEELTRTGGER